MGSGLPPFYCLGSSSQSTLTLKASNTKPESAAKVPSSHEAAGRCRFLEAKEVREGDVKQQDLNVGARIPSDLVNNIR